MKSIKWIHKTERIEIKISKTKKYELGCQQSLVDRKQKPQNAKCKI